MCSPSCVRNASVRIKDFGQVRFFLIDELFELCNLAHFFECKHLILFVSIDSKACRVLWTNQWADGNRCGLLTRRLNTEKAGHEQRAMAME